MWLIMSDMTDIFCNQSYESLSVYAIDMINYTS